MNRGIKILSSSRYLPPRIFANEEFEKTLDTTSEWIKSRTGISNRRFAMEENNTNMASKAVSSLIKKSGVELSDIGILAVASFTPDSLTPSTATQIHEKLSLDKEMMCFDLNAACTGFIYGLEIIRGLLLTSNKSKAILVCSEKISSYLDFNDRNSAVLFGDGAAAILVSLDESKYYSYISTKGYYYPLNCDINNNFNSEKSYLKMDGKEVFRFASNAMKEAIEKVIEKSAYGIDDIDHFISHQANERIISHVIKKMKLDKSKFYLNLDKYANTSAASIPIAIDEMSEKGILKKGDKLLCVGFGAGLTYGSSLFTW